MIDVSDIILDTDLAQSFSIQRSTGSFALGGYVSSLLEILATGIIQPAGSRDLAQVAEADRVTGAIAVWATVPLYLTRAGDPSGLSDTITWRGDSYRIVKLFPYADFGYFKAIAVRMSGV